MKKIPFIFEHTDTESWTDGRKTYPGIWTVGRYVEGEWEPHSDWTDPKRAELRAKILNRRMGIA